MAKNRFVEEVYGKQTSNRFVNEAYGLSNSDYEPYRQSTVRSTIANIKTPEQRAVSLEPKEKQFKYNLERFDLGRNEGKIGTGWEKRANLDNLWGEHPAASAYDRKIAEKKSQLDATAPNSSNMNDSTRYQILQDIRQLEKDKESYDKGKEEQFNTAKWEAQQRLSIAATMDQNLFDNLVRLNELKKTSSAEDIYSSFGVMSGTNAKEQYNSLYRQLYEKYGDDVKDWLEYTSRVKNREETELQIQKAAQSAKEHPILSSAVSIPANLGSGLGYLDVAAQRLNRAVTGSDTPIDYNTPAMYPSKLTNTIRGSVSQKIAEDTEGKIGSDTPLGNLYSAGYNLAMSMGDSALAMATGGGTALIGAAAATNAMNEAVSRGASTDQALAVGLIAGTMEGVMEKVSIDSLFNIKAPGNLRQAILNIMKQGGVESTEEAATTLANTLADAIIMGDKSDLRTSQRKYMSMGYSYSEAEKKALSDWGMGLVGDALGGFVSGGLFSSGKEIAEGIYNRKSALDFAIEETLKPTQEQTNLDRAMEGLFENNKTAKADTGSESTNVNTNPAVHTTLEQDVNGNTDQSDVMDHGAVGAAEIGFNPYSNFQNQTDNFLPEGANAARLVDMPAVDPTGKPVRRGAKTIYGAQTTSDARAEQMETEYMEGLYGYDPVRDKPTLEKAKAKIAQDGYDRAYSRVTERLQSMKKLKETGLEAYLLYADAVKNGNDADAAELCLLLTQSGTEFAQGVQLFSMFRKLTPEGQLMGVERLVQRINDKYDGSNISIDENLIEEFRNAADQDSRDAVMEKIYQDIGQKIPTTFAEAANQWRYTAMLLNPSTHIKNMGGNLSMMAMKLLKDAAGTGIEKIANSVSGGKVGRTKSIINVFSKSDQALLQKAWADFGNVQDDVAGIGKNKDNVMGKVGEYRSYWKLNDPQGSTAKLVDGVLRGAEKVPQFNSKLMEAEDMIFSRPDYAVSLAGYMKANKLTEITAEARAYAIKEAQKATFRDANAVSKFARKIGTGDHKFWNWVANAIFPFKGTPANVGVRAFEYSPAGLLKALTYDIYRVKTGKISATEYIDNLSSGLTGSALSAVGYYLAQAGFLRATGVGDEKEKEQQREDGYKDNSFRLFGYSIPENVFTSASAPMFVGAALYEALATKALSGEAYSIDEIFQVLAATADPILGQTMLDGLSDTFYTIRSAQGGMGQVTAALAVNVVGNYISSFIPTILSRISSAADSVGREAYVDKNKPLTGVQKEVQGLMMKSPARQFLHEKVDNYGRAQETWNPFGDDNAAQKALNFAANVLTPTYPSKIKDTPVEDELNRLYRSGEDTSDRKIFQTETPKSITVDKKTVNLTQDQHEEFEKIRGDNTMEYQGAMQESELYDKLDDTLKINATDKMYDFIEQTSKDMLGIGYQTDDWVADLKGKSQDEIVETVIKKTVESYAKSDNFSGKYDGITSMLESGNIDEAMAVSMLPKEAEDGYFNQIKGSGVEISTFIDVYQFKTDARSDYDKDGKTVKSAQEKVIEYINRVEKSPEKKRRLFLSMGYAESKIPEEWK